MFETCQSEPHAVVAHVFCNGCSWLLAPQVDNLLTCLNPRCSEQWKKFKLYVELTEVEQVVHHA